eukprot:917131_1
MDPSLMSGTQIAILSTSSVLVATFNFIVILAICFLKRIHTIDYMVGNMALSDMVVSVLFMSFMWTSGFNTHNLSNSMCQIVAFLMGTSVFGSVSAITVVAYSRYWVIRHAGLGGVPRKKTAIWIGLSWVMPACVMSLQAILRVAEPSRTGSYCIVRYGYTEWKRLIPSLAHSIYVPMNFLAVIYFYWRVYARSMIAVPNLRMTAKDLHQVKRVTQYMRLICLVFVGMWTPSTIAMWYRLITNNERPIPLMISAILDTTLLLNSLLNPILYFIAFPDYRPALKRLFTCDGCTCYQKLKNIELHNRKPRKRNFGRAPEQKRLSQMNASELLKTGNTLTGQPRPLSDFNSTDKAIARKYMG